MKFYIIVTYACYLSVQMKSPLPRVGMCWLACSGMLNFVTFKGSSICGGPPILTMPISHYI